MIAPFFKHLIVIMEVWTFLPFSNSQKPAAVFFLDSVAVLVRPVNILRLTPKLFCLKITSNSVAVVRPVMTPNSFV